MKKIEEGKNNIPKVLIRAKETAQSAKQNNSAHEKGPWDKGHWANRK